MMCGEIHYLERKYQIYTFRKQYEVGAANAGTKKRHIHIFFILKRHQ